jgi:hypothetical protein
MITELHLRLGCCDTENECTGTLTIKKRKNIGLVNGQFKNVPLLPHDSK